MNTLIQQLKNTLPAGMEIPDAIQKLYQWIEDNNFIRDTENGLRYGFLYPDDKLNESWTDDEREGGTLIDFAALGNNHLKYWFGREDAEIYNRLCVFAKSGGEGSQCALWKADDGSVKIVHLGSGSGSVLCCILADDAIDFLRLLAIGYDEICWDECYPYTPKECDEEYRVMPNVLFQNWVKETFATNIPKTALEIVKHPAHIGDKEPEDAFCRWCNKIIG